MSGGRPHKRVLLVFGLFRRAKIERVVDDEQFVVNTLSDGTKELEVCLVGLNDVVIGDARVLGLNLQVSVHSDSFHNLPRGLVCERTSLLIPVELLELT